MPRAAWVWRGRERRVRQGTGHAHGYSRERGQSTVEVVGMLPLLVLVAMAAGQLLAAGVAHELAGHAAEAGAVAVLQGGDPARAARDALPGWADDRVVVRVNKGRVRVQVRPPAPVAAVGRMLAATVEADAGEPRP